jgi:hypothetical protein
MTSLGPALQFHVKHAEDIQALEGCDDPPDGVNAEEWEQYHEVLGLAAQQAVALLRQCREAAEDALKLIVKKGGRRSQARSVEVTWDTSLPFGFLGRGRPRGQPDGAIGTRFFNCPPRLVPYLVLEDGDRSAALRAAVKVAVDGQKLLADESRLAIGYVVVEPESDVEALVKQIAACFTAAASSLEGVAT